MQVWYESTLKYMKVDQCGSERMVTEVFLLDAVNYTDAESRMIRQAQSMVKGGEFTVRNIKQSNVAEVFPYEIGQWWYKFKVSLVTIDEDKGREKRIAAHYLLEADNAKEALERLDESLNYLVIPYEVESLVKTKIMDVFPYDLAEGAARMSAKTEEKQEA